MAQDRPLSMVLNSLCTRPLAAPKAWGRMAEKGEPPPQGMGWRVRGGASTDSHLGIHRTAPCSLEIWRHQPLYPQPGQRYCQRTHQSARPGGREGDKRVAPALTRAATLDPIQQVLGLESSWGRGEEQACSRAATSLSDSRSLTPSGLHAPT